MDAKNPSPRMIEITPEITKIAELLAVSYLQGRRLGRVSDRDFAWQRARSYATCLVILVAGQVGDEREATILRDDLLHALDDCYKSTSYEESMVSDTEYFLLDMFLRPTSSEE